MSRIFLLATGQSINDITNNEWNFLKNEKTIGISWFIKKNFETTYYYTHEFDIQPGEVGRTILSKNWNTHCFFGTKHYENKNCHEIINSPHIAYNKYKNKIKCNQLNFGHFTHSWNGKNWKLSEDLPPLKFEDVWAKNFNEILFGFRGTLMCSINLCSILGFDEIILCGVDLKNGFHFYESNLSPFERNLLKNYDPSKNNHSTNIPYDNTRGIMDGIKWVSKHIKLKTFSTKSLLYDEGFELFDKGEIK